jgi:hypothetical protein
MLATLYVQGLGIVFISSCLLRPPLTEINRDSYNNCVSLTSVGFIYDHVAYKAHTLLL